MTSWCMRMTPNPVSRSRRTTIARKKAHAYTVSVYQRKNSRYVVTMSDSDFFRQKVFNFKLEPENTVCADCGKDGEDYVHAGMLLTCSVQVGL